MRFSSRPDRTGMSVSPFRSGSLPTPGGSGRAPRSPEHSLLSNRCSNPRCTLSDLYEPEANVQVRRLGLITGLVAQPRQRAAPFLLVHRAIRFGDEFSNGHGIRGIEARCPQTDGELVKRVLAAQRV